MIQVYFAILGFYINSNLINRDVLPWVQSEDVYLDKVRVDRNARSFFIG